MSTNGLACRTRTWQFEVVKALGAKGADLNRQNKRGETALMLAVENVRP